MGSPLADRDPIAGYRIQQGPAGWLVTFDDGTQGGPYATRAAANQGAPVKAPAVSMLSGVVVPSDV